MFYHTYGVLKNNLEDFGNFLQDKNLYSKLFNCMDESKSIETPSQDEFSLYSVELPIKQPYGFKLDNEFFLKYLDDFSFKFNQNSDPNPNFKTLSNINDFSIDEYDFFLNSIKLENS